MATAGKAVEWYLRSDWARSGAVHVKRHGAIARDEIRNTNDQSDAAHILEHSPRPTARVAALSFPSGAMTHYHTVNLVTELDHPIRCSSPAECLPAKADIVYWGWNVRFGSRVDGAIARAFLTLLQHWSGAVTCPACLCGGSGRWP